MTPMSEATGILFSAAGFIIIAAITIIAFAAKRWLKGFDDFKKAILSGLESIQVKIGDLKEQIGELKTDSQLQNQAIREIETRVETRFQGIESRLDSKRERFTEIEKRILCIEKTVNKMEVTCRLHIAKSKS